MGIALGLGGLGFAASAEAAPPATSQTPDTLALAGSLADQALNWGPCTFTTSIAPDVRALLEATPNQSCADVTVPLDWHDPANGKTLTIRVSRVDNVALTSDAYQGTILVNPGGPGGEALHWGANILRRAPELKTGFNTIGIDPRGVGQSEQPTCLADSGLLAQGGAAAAKATGDACSQNEVVTKITTEQTAYDFDFVRGLLGVPKITYIGYSYGTWLGAWYGSLFSANIERMILDSAIDGTATTLQSTWDLQPVARDRQFVDAVLPYTARSIARAQEGAPDGAPIRSLPSDPATVSEYYWASVERNEAQAPGIALWVWAYSGGLSAFPDPSAYPLAAGAVQIFVEDEVAYRATTAAAAPASTTLSLVAAAGTDADKSALVRQALEGSLTIEQREAFTPTFDLIAETAATAAEPSGELVDAYAPFDAIRCGDGQWTQGQAYWDEWEAGLKQNQPFTGMLATALYPACAFWPTDNPTKPAPNKKAFPQTLVIQAEEDSQTGYEGGYVSGTKLPNTTFLAVDNGTKHGYFPYRTSCVDDPAFAFLTTGATPKKTTICQAKPLPNEATTVEMWSPINVNGKHVPGKGTIPSRVADPETGVIDTTTIAGATAQAEVVQAVIAAMTAAAAH